MTEPTTYLQGAYRAPVAATIRYTYDPGGSPTTSDWTVAIGDTWNSAEELLAEWTAQIVSDLGAGHSIAVLASTTNHYGICQVDTPGLNWSITWSQAGDGTDVRDFLGATGDLSNQSDGGVFQSYIPASFYPPWAAPRVLRVATAPRRGHMVRLNGSSQTQHHQSPASSTGDPADLDPAVLEVVLWFGDPSGVISYIGHQQLERFVNNLYDAATGSLETFSIFHDSQQWVGRFADGPALMPRRVQGSVRGRVWTVSFQMIAEVTPW